jgi:hypothetical protein
MPQAFYSLSNFSSSFQKGQGVIVIEEQTAKLWTRIVGR